MPGRLTVNDQEVLYLGAQQPPGQAKPVKPAADDENVEHRFPIHARRRWHLGLVIVAENIDLVL